MTTPLLLASKQGNVRLVKILIEAGAKIDVKGPDGKSALMVALEKGPSGAKVVEALVRAGADVNGATSDDTNVNESNDTQTASRSFPEN